MKTAPVYANQLSFGRSPITPPAFTEHSLQSIKAIPEPNSRQTGATRARRPFKYLKHKGPRPNPAVETRDLMVSPRDSIAQGHSSVDGLPGYKMAGALKSSGAPGWANVKPYYQPTSRLFRSRNLNLSALDISACKSKTPKVEVLRDGVDSLVQSSDSRHSCTPFTDRQSARMSQSKRSCFSDWSTSASTSRRVSYSVSGSAVTSQMCHPLSSRETSSSKAPHELRPCIKGRSETFDSILQGGQMGAEAAKTVHKNPYTTSDVFVIDENCHLRSLPLN